jgi:hypothetical protein
MGCAGSKIDTSPRHPLKGNRSRPIESRRICECCSGIHRTTRETHAAIFPQGKCAEELNAAKEGRKSLWGSPEFHRGMTGL